MRSDYTQGFTLIEVLVSILILSIGVLGVTALQMRGLDGNRNALLRVQASQLASDLIQRIEVNGATTYGPVSLGDVPPVPTNCNDSNCTPAQIAQFDTTQWLCSINSIASDGTTFPACQGLSITGVLPLGEASLVMNGDEYEMKIEWSDIKSSQTRSVELFMQVPQ
jgi:type IV pilus assembly protein PilV